MRKVWLTTQGIAMAAAVAATAWVLPGIASSSEQATTLRTSTVTPSQLVTGSRMLPANHVVRRSASGRTVYVRFVLPKAPPGSSVVSGRIHTWAGGATDFLVVAPVLSGDPAAGSPAQFRLGHPLAEVPTRGHDQSGAVTAVTNSLLARGSFWVAVQLFTRAPARVRASWTRVLPHIALLIKRRLPAPSPIVKPSGQPTPAPSSSTLPTPAPSSSTLPAPSPSSSTQPTPSPSDSPKPSPSPTQPAPASGTLFGTSAQAQGNETAVQTVARLRAQFGQLGALRLYSPGTAKPWPSITTQAGSTPVIMSFKESPKTVLSGAVDSYYRAWFAAAPRDHVDYWTYWHEPEDDIERGAFTAADYRAAWTHLKALADQAHNPQLKATLILMGWTIEQRSHRTFTDYYPGSSVVDVLGWDVYNPGGQKGLYPDPAIIYGAEIALSASLGKPFGIAETGSILPAGDNGQARAAWLTSMGHYLRGQHALFVTYFESTVGGDFRLNDVPSQQAWRTVSMGG